MVRMEEIADTSFAVIFERKRFGIATAAMTKIMVTTISNSISENPFCLRIILVSPGQKHQAGTGSHLAGIRPTKTAARIRPLSVTG